MPGWKIIELRIYDKDQQESPDFQMRGRLLSPVRVVKELFSRSIRVEEEPENIDREIYDAIDILETSPEDEIVIQEQEDTPEGSIQDISIHPVEVIDTGKESDIVREDLQACTQDERVKEMPKAGARANIQIFVRRKALLEAKDHAKEDLSREAGGVLLGKILISTDDRPRVAITGIVRAQRAVRQPASVSFTPEAWADIWRNIDNHQDYRDEKMWQVVGWYHTHPGFGVFLSSLDMSIHNGHFTQPGHLALVLDPQTDKHGFFGWDKQGKDVVICSDADISQIDDRRLRKLLVRDEGLPIADLPASLVELIPSSAQSEQHEPQEVLSRQAASNVDISIEDSSTQHEPGSNLDKGAAVPDISSSVATEVVAVTNSETSGEDVSSEHRNATASDNISPDAVADQANTAEREEAE